MKKPFVTSIKTKFFLTAAVIMAVSSATWGGWAWYNERNHLIQNLTNNGKLLLTTLRAPIINAFVYEEAGVLEDVGVLDAFIEAVVSIPELPTLYVFITDQNGKILAHNDHAKYGTTAADLLTDAVLNSEHFLSAFSRPEAKRAEVLDLGLPLRVAGKNWGTLRVGYSLEPLEQELITLKWQVFSFSGIFFLIGTVVFYAIGVTMSRPLEQLSGAMTRLKHGALEDVPQPTDRNDEIGHLQRSFRDMVLRLQRSEQERRLAVNHLISSEKLATIGKIVTGVAHEVNNPLAAISFSISSLETKVAPPLKHHTEIIRNGISRIETIVRQLTDFNRAGILELEPVNSDFFFNETVSFAGIVLKQFSVQFQATNLCPPMNLCLDRFKLHQVVLNLLLNAAAASPANGTVHFSARMEGEWYIFAVQDSGSGIDSDELSSIFELFYTTKQAGEGSGIGLAICRNIVEMHRGQIACASTHEETIFTVRIPLPTGGADGKHEAADC